MATYMVVFTTGASSVIEVEASSVEEARKLANKRFDGPSLCHQCSRHINLGDWEHDESDPDFVEKL